MSPNQGRSAGDTMILVTQWSASVRAIRRSEKAGCRLSTSAHPRLFKPRIGSGPEGAETRSLSNPDSRLGPQANPVEYADDGIQPIDSHYPSLTRSVSYGWQARQVCLAAARSAQADRSQRSESTASTHLS